MMKRCGADLRGGSLPTLTQDAQPCGPLTEEEISAVRRAYENGCRGEIVIGMRGNERIITMLVPEAIGVSPADRLPKIREELRSLGCNWLQRVRLTYYRRFVGHRQLAESAQSCANHVTLNIPSASPVGPETSLE